MAKSPLGRVEMLADHFGAGKEMIMGLILGQNSADDNPWFDAECGRQPLMKILVKECRRSLTIIISHLI